MAHRGEVQREKYRFPALHLEVPARPVGRLPLNPRPSAGAGGEAGAGPAGRRAGRRGRPGAPTPGLSPDARLGRRGRGTRTAPGLRLPRPEVRGPKARIARHL